LKLRQNGTVEWQRTYGGRDTDLANSIWFTHDGGYIVAGQTNSFGAGGADFLVLGLTMDGSINPSCNFMRVTSILGKDSNAIPKTGNVSVRDSKASSWKILSTVRATNAPANILCP
jgi:hypothetical protein